MPIPSHFAFLHGGEKIFIGLNGLSDSVPHFLICNFLLNLSSFFVVVVCFVFLRQIFMHKLFMGLACLYINLSFSIGMLVLSRFYYHDYAVSTPSHESYEGSELLGSSRQLGQLKMKWNEHGNEGEAKSKTDYLFFCTDYKQYCQAACGLANCYEQ